MNLDNFSQLPVVFTSWVNIPRLEKKKKTEKRKSLGKEMEMSIRGMQLFPRNFI